MFLRASGLAIARTGPQAAAARIISEAGQTNPKIQRHMIDDSWYIRTSGLAEVTSAGGVVLRSQSGRVYVALITELDHPHYVLPKGHVEPGESTEAAARREVGEEAGLHELTLIRSLGARQRQNFERTKWKTIHYFLYTTDEVEFDPIEGDKHPDAGWFALDDLPTLFWPDQREMLAELRRQLDAQGPELLSPAENAHDR